MQPASEETADAIPGKAIRADHRAQRSAPAAAGGHLSTTSTSAGAFPCADSPSGSFPILRASWIFSTHGGRHERSWSGCPGCWRGIRPIPGDVGEIAACDQYPRAARCLRLHLLDRAESHADVEPIKNA